MTNQPSHHCHSLQVSIPQWCDCCQSQSQNQNDAQSFQSHNGAIAAERNLQASFERIAVSIPQWCDCCSRSTTGRVAQPVSFNPTMVRLLPARNIYRHCSNLPFQSHNGAIAAMNSVTCLQFMSCFNPTMVRLLPLSGLRLKRIEVSFNPTMVRLLLEALKVDLNELSQFQSHNGAIAAGTYC